MHSKSYTEQEQGIHNRDFVSLQVSILITKLFKSNLTALDKLKNTAPIPEESATEARKEILDSGNDAIRDIQNLLSVFDFYINPQRLAEAKFPKKIVKKVVICGVSELK